LVDVTKKSWWKNSPDYSLPMIHSVKKFFTSTKKEILL